MTQRPRAAASGPALRGSCIGPRISLLLTTASGGRAINTIIYWAAVISAAAAVAGLAWKARALSFSGAMAATLIGSIIFGFGGTPFALVLVFFFVSSSALSALPGDAERSRRGARQVMANGAIPALAAAATSLFFWAPFAFAGALAAATADTWASEIGIRFGRTPRSILTLKPRHPGASGAVTVVGTLAAIAGSIALATFALWLLPLDRSAFVAVAAGGVIGAVADSVLGDGLQASYRCPECGAEPEVANHEGCERRAERRSGVAGLDNDIVNWITSLVGAASALALRCWI